MTYQAANRLATVADEAVEFDADGNMILGGVIAVPGSVVYNILFIYHIFNKCFCIPSN